MREYSREMNQRALEAKEAAARDAQSGINPGMINAALPPLPMPSNPMPDMPPGDSTSPMAKRPDQSGGPDEDEGKRNLITNEIQMFRDRFKDEDTKMRNTERERKDRYERERLLLREKRMAEEVGVSGNDKSGLSPSSRDASPPSSRDRSSPRRDRHSSNRRDRSPPSDDRYRGSSSRGNASNAVRSRTNDRRVSPTSRYDRRSPPPPSRPYGRRSRTKSPMSKSHPNEEDDDETYERKKQERRLREKEIRYREVTEHLPACCRTRSFVFQRLKAWEQRERKKENEYDGEKRRELNRLREEEKEGKRLLAFLEDYNDETEDPKFYK